MKTTTMSSLAAASSTWESSTSIIRKVSRHPWAIHTLTNVRETNQKTLEEIAAAFGDHVVEVDEQEIVAEGVAMESKALPVHLEDARSA